MNSLLFDFRSLTSIIGTTLALVTTINVAASAVQLRDGKVYFVQPPRLINATTTFKDVNVWGATYYFTLDLPANAGEALAVVTINQKEGAERIRFKLKDTIAFAGTRDCKGQQLTLGEVTQQRSSRTVSVIFNPPVTPGKTITIGLRPVRNPMLSGVYLFGLTAFPQGEKTHGQFLGFGRLQFYGDRLFGFP